MRKRRITMVVGEPCVGKSSIVRRILDTSNVKWTLGIRPFRHHTCERLRFTIIGRYDEANHQFPGTDRLSMSVQPIVQRWIEDDPLRHDVLFEGDRLGNLKMATWAMERGFDFRMVVVTVSPDVLHARREAERVQPEPFVRGRATKIANMRAALPESVVFAISNDTPLDTLANAEWLVNTRYCPRD